MAGRDDRRGLDDSGVGGGMAVAAVGRHRAEGLLVLRPAGGFKLHANILLYVTTRERAPGLQVERASESECRICERRTERERVCVGKCGGWVREWDRDSE